MRWLLGQVQDAVATLWRAPSSGPALQQWGENARGSRSSPAGAIAPREVVMLLSAHLRGAQSRFPARLLLLERLAPQCEAPSL